MLEDAIAKELIKVITEPRPDQWGNIQPSIVSDALAKYVENNKEVLFEKIAETFDSDKIAELISEKLEDVIKGIYGSSYERDLIKSGLKDKIGEHLAKKIASDLKL